MSQPDSEADGAEHSTAETDWLANSYLGYGYGYTKEQALLWMAAHVGALDEGQTIEVDLVEHVGNARVSMGGWSVETFVSGERYELDAETFNDVRDLAIRAQAESERALDREPDEEITE